MWFSCLLSDELIRTRAWNTIPSFSAHNEAVSQETHAPWNFDVCVSSLGIQISTRTLGSLSFTCYPLIRPLIWGDIFKPVLLALGFICGACARTRGARALRSAFCYFTPLACNAALAALYMHMMHRRGCDSHRDPFITPCWRAPKYLRARAIYKVHFGFTPALLGMCRFL